MGIRCKFCKTPVTESHCTKCGKEMSSDCNTEHVLPPGHTVHPIARKRSKRIETASKDLAKDV